VGLCLSVKKDYELVIGEDIKIRFRKVCSGTNQMMIEAPKDIKIKLNKIESIEPKIVKASTLKSQT
jgi:sRNA-binding carbon storage regulator CsrA